MRANEFINEGWYDDAKSKVKAANRQLNRTGNNAIRNVANAVKTSKVGQAAATGANAVKSAATAAAPVAKTVGGAVARGLGKLGFGGDKFFGFNNPLKTSTRAAMSTEIFIKNFLGSLDATQKRQAQLKQPFDLGTFAVQYMKKNNWEAGDLQNELNAAVASRNPKQVAMVMDKIGTENTVDPNAKGPEINMTPGAYDNRYGQMGNLMAQAATAAAQPRQSLAQKMASKGMTPQGVRR
jgi:hypothetical protein